ncbi:hypothetical protein O6P43_014221 [Quillaja saponaria]|uniref:Uncharacterized protein n=1 Tax=Quillaja saponaria TaxID=32244 RepID=A0AAD7PRP2_QUISA|nr:hypothetical protein O6P43_014221 [Quillaja saponaria]
MRCVDSSVSDELNQLRVYFNINIGSPGQSTTLTGNSTSRCSRTRQARSLGFHPAIRASVRIHTRSPNSGAKTVEIHLVDQRP